MKIEELYKIFEQHNVISTDSRKIEKNSLFFALKGETFDGNKFAKTAIEAGAAYAVVDDKSLNDKHFIVVDNVLNTLQALAAFHRKMLALPIIAITGSNGKTTTKELINSVLSKKYKTAVTQGNFNNQIGVALTLLKMTKENNFGIVEMGTNHFGEIENLCKIVQPNFGLITNIGKAHLEFFISKEGVAKAKGELFDFLKSNGGKAFVNSDISEIFNLSQKINFDEKQLIQYNAKKFAVNILPTTAENPFLQFNFDKLHVSTHLLGEYNINNALAAIAVGKYFDISNADTVSAIESYMPQNNRSQLINTAKNHLYMDAYNANPTSMQAALMTFINQKSAHKALILGDMRELGEASAFEHQKIVTIIGKENFDNVFFVGKNFTEAAEHRGYKCFANVDDLCKYLSENQLTDKNILIKGSHSIQLEKLAAYL